MKELKRLTPLAQPFRCPFCFEAFEAEEIVFRCQTRTCKGQKVDPVYTNFRSNAQSMGGEIGGALMGNVIDPPKQSEEKKRPLWERATLPRSATCSFCGKESRTYLCPICHFELPHDIESVRPWNIAIVGSRGGGKSFLIGSFIHALQNHLVTSMGITMSMLEDDTQERWLRDFYRPIFRDRTLLPPTEPAETDIRVKIPLILRLTKAGLLRNHYANLSLFDSSGEDMNKSRTISEHVRSMIFADGLVFVIDPWQIRSVRDRLADSGIQPTAINEMSSPESLLDRLFGLLEREERIKVGAKVSIPTAFVVTKIDTLKPLLDPGSLLMSTSTHSHTLNLKEIETVSEEVKGWLARWLTPGFLGKIEQRFTCYSYFGVSALGDQPRAGARLEVLDALRVEEPFLWILYKKGFVQGKRA
jgi:hypothetical protein